MVSCSMNSSPSLYCKLSFKYYLSIDFHVSDCALWSDMSCRRHRCDMLGVIKSVPSQVSPYVRTELHMRPWLYSKSVGNHIHLRLLTALPLTLFFCVCSLLWENDRKNPCSCLYKDCSHYKKRKEKRRYMLGARQGGRQGRRETWVEWSWEERVYKSLERKSLRTWSADSGVDQEWKICRNKVVNEGAWGIESLLILVMANKSLGQVDDVPLWKRKKLGCGWNVGNWAPGALRRMRAICSYVCVMEAKGVLNSRAIQVPSWDDCGRGQKWFWMLVFVSGQAREEWKGEHGIWGKLGREAEDLSSSDK